jgi:flagellar assembly protein FliH
LSSKLIKRSQHPEGVTDFRDLISDLDIEAALDLSARDPRIGVLRSGIFERARAQGFEQGYKEGKAEARRESEQEKARLRRAVDAVISQVQRSRANALAQAQQEVGDLVLEVARKILKDEVRWNRDVVLGIVKDAIRRVVDKETVRVRVNIEDLPAVKEARGELLSTIDGIQNLEIVDDRRVGLGGAIIETSSGTIDARIETQLEEIKRAFEGRLT